MVLNKEIRRLVLVGPLFMAVVWNRFMDSKFLKPIMRGEDPTPSSVSTRWNETVPNNDDRVENRQQVPGATTAIQQKHRPLVIVHIGPPKTGTTSVQNFLACHDQVLEKDNFFFLGKVNRECAKKQKKDWVRPFVQLQGLPRKMRDIDGSKLRDEIHERLNNGNNVILSDESFVGTSEKSGPLLQSLNTTTSAGHDIVQHDVVLFIGYRRYYDWMLSLYHYENTPQWYAKAAWEKWPSQGGAKVPTLTEFFHRHIVNQHPAAEYRDAFSQTIPNVVYLNLHNTNDVLSEFLCEAVPSMRHSCTYYTSDVLAGTEKKANRRDAKDPHSLDYELLAHQAFVRGLIHGNITRRRAVQGIKTKFQTMYCNQSDNSDSNNTETLPLQCLTSPQKAKLLNASLYWERTLLPDFFNTKRGEAELTTQFAKEQFCTVNVEQVFDSKAWEPFFECLKQGYWC